MHLPGDDLVMQIPLQSSGLRNWIDLPKSVFNLKARRPRGDV
jgi:hypothetical protein